MLFAVCVSCLRLGPGAYMVRFLRVRLGLELCVSRPTGHSALGTWCPWVGATHQERTHQERAAGSHLLLLRLL